MSIVPKRANVVFLGFFFTFFEIAVTQLYTGEPGPPGLKGIKGDSGEPGVQGPAGLNGSEGDPGVDGFPGQKGELGISGHKGDRGLAGDIGPDGTSQNGFVGDPGDPGSPGVPGIPGLDGIHDIPGEKGEPGLPGPEGEKGYAGFPGLAGIYGNKGETILHGSPGSRGPKGDKGAEGDVGIKGKEGDIGFARWVLVRHSQTAAYPQCGPNTTMLWEGFSFLQSRVKGEVYHQDLGTAGSCLKMFSMMPFVSCDLEGTCNYASTNDESSTWLSTNDEFPTLPVAGRAISPYISRCVVCQSVTPAIAVHSQTSSIPECPSGWEGLWEGFSLIAGLTAARGGGGDVGGLPLQSLSSPGSCIEHFVKFPFLECSIARGSCRLPPQQSHFWLSAVDLAQMASKRSFIPDQYHPISRCQVCIRMISI